MSPSPEKNEIESVCFEDINKSENKEMVALDLENKTVNSFQTTERLIL